MQKECDSTLSTQFFMHEQFLLKHLALEYEGKNKRTAFSTLTPTWTPFFIPLQQILPTSLPTPPPDLYCSPSLCTSSSHCHHNHPIISFVSPLPPYSPQLSFHPFYPLVHPTPDAFFPSTHLPSLTNIPLLPGNHMLFLIHIELCLVRLPIKSNNVQPLK